MNLSIIVATLEGCAFDVIDNPEGIKNMLRESVEAGGFTMLHSHVHRFEPQGVTGAAVLSESHIAIHSWPEEGVLFVDIATCGTYEATEAAFNRICELVPHETVRRQDVDYEGRSSGSRGPSRLTARNPVARPSASERPRVEAGQGIWQLGGLPAGA